MLLWIQPWVTADKPDLEVIQESSYYKPEIIQGEPDYLIVTIEDSIVSDTPSETENETVIDYPINNK